MGEKAEFGGWWIFILGLVIVSVVILGALGYAGKFTGTVVERKVFEQSYQRSESYKERIATLEASLVELRAREQQPNLSDNTKAEIATQISAITAQLNAARSQQ